MVRSIIAMPVACLHCAPYMVLLSFFFGGDYQSHSFKFIDANVAKHEPLPVQYGYGLFWLLFAVNWHATLSNCCIAAAISYGSILSDYFTFTRYLYAISSFIKTVNTLPFRTGIQHIYFAFHA
jgi:hypothetical protein